MKYAAGESARPGGLQPLRPLEGLALAHAAIFLLWLTWGFGGGAESMRPYLAWWGTMGALLTLTALQDREAWKEGWMRPLAWLWPMLAFGALVFIACFNPSFREIRVGTDTLLAQRETSPWLPGAAQPQLALRGLWYFAALWIPAFNIALLVRQRWALRALLILIVVNSLVLAIFGTAQKLIHAKGIYFGLVVPRQTYFFSTFIYHNHWGAFTLLSIAVCLGLVWHYSRRHQGRNFLHSPAFNGLVVVLVLFATLPLSGSRSSTLLGLALLGGAFLHWLIRFIRLRHRHRESIALPLAGVAVSLLLAGAAVWYVAGDMIEKRAALTRQQVGVMVAQGGIGSRAELYRNTWAMARDRLLFGWGMGSYPHVFALYNRQVSVDKLPVFYRDAHSDWLQAFAEHGLVGSALLALMAILPLLRLRRSHFSSPLAGYLLAGCALLLLYAWVEFPFGNFAVVYLWWLVCFCAVQYARLQDRESSGLGKPETTPATAVRSPA
jgi:O-antigen ligase